ncbi:kinesin-13, putative [Plasmodium relictum]|uniref:Kinesin-13, putative n=1 Tax=Plasmodium relictum TaxID=85471 RepID=A0A1J1HBT1_PLARL|nr:kinesin-13, putative [Plasmodium relictum]CRH02867.1 kinesin-13, putative [Plasmodium relictum]
MQQKRQSIIKNKSEAYPQKSVNLGNKLKNRTKNVNSKIKVVVRKRPISELEKKKKDNDIITVKDNCTIYIDEPRYKVDMTKYIERHEFIVDKVFNEDVDNYTVYLNTIKPLLVDIFENNCVCSCFAYGQTGSGKTYTMLGSQPYGQSDTPGIFQYAADDIFNFLKIYDTDNNKGIFISFYEIYCGKLYDLLQKRKMVAALENGKKEVVVKDLKVLRVLTKEELILKMIDGVLLRKIGVNSQNDESSRSHAILNIDLKDLNKNISLGKIAFIDLAGSERGADTVSQNKQTQTDGANINRSLLALKECIRAMDSDKNHIPFRDSELTKVLRDIFVGKSKSIMIANISPTISCCEQTLNTLRYSSRVKNFKNKTSTNEDEDGNNEKISILDSKNTEYNNANIENIPIKSSNYMQNNKISIKLNDIKAKNSTLKSKNIDKNKDISIHGKFNSINDFDKIKKKKKKSLLNYDNNLYYDNAAKKHNIAQQNYTFTDTSDFSSIDEMNCNLNNNEKNIFLNNKNGKSGKIKSRSSCDTTNSKMKNDILFRHSAGNVLPNFKYEQEQIKDKIFLKSNNLDKAKDKLNNMNNFYNVITDKTTANKNNTSAQSIIQKRNINEKENNKNSDNIFFDAISYNRDNSNQLNPYNNQNLFSTNNNSLNNPYINNNDTYMSSAMNYDYTLLDKNSYVDIKNRSEQTINIFNNNEGNNNNNFEKNSNEFNNNLSSINAIISESSAYNNDFYDLNYHSNNNNIINNNTCINNNNILNDYLNLDQNYSSNTVFNSNASKHIDKEKKKIVNNEEMDKNNDENTNKISNFSNSEYLNQFQNNINNMLNNCLNSLNITNLYEDTQNILNNILLSKYKTDKDSVIKKYINEDINNMSLEELDKYAQLIYEKRKIILNKLLFLFKKNVDIQTNNETSDLKKDLVMCHICSNNPDDQFHYYAYSRLEKDIINLIMLRQFWCESENLRLLHQYLTIEYQNRSANSILFNVPNNNENSSSLNKKYVEDIKNSQDINFNKNENNNSTNTKMN